MMIIFMSYFQLILSNMKNKVMLSSQIIPKQIIVHPTISQTGILYYCAVVNVINLPSLKKIVRN